MPSRSEQVFIESAAELADQMAGMLARHHCPRSTPRPRGSRSAPAASCPVCALADAAAAIPAARPPGARS